MQSFILNIKQSQRKCSYFYLLEGSENLTDLYFFFVSLPTTELNMKNSSYLTIPKLFPALHWSAQCAPGAVSVIYSAVQP